MRIIDEKGRDVDELVFGENKDDAIRTFNIFNDGESLLSWQITKTVDWISQIRPDEGTLKSGETQSVIVSIDRTLLTGNNNSTPIYITSNNGSKQLTISAIGETKPTIEIIDISSVDLEYAHIRTDLEEEGIPACTEYGVVISTSPSPSLENAMFIVTKKYKKEKTCYFSVQNLWPRTEYYVKAFATNELGTSYSMERTFTTKSPDLPKFSSYKIFHAFESGFSIIGKCYYPGTPAALEWGYIVSTYNNDVCPSFDNNGGRMYFTGTIKTNTYYLADFSFTKSCSSYFVIAYAITKYDTVYESSCYLVETQVPFKDLEGIAVSYEDEFRWDNSDGYTYLMSYKDAKNACEQLVLGKYDDWRLPTYEELRTMYEHRNEIGGFSQYQYWSSSKNIEDPDFNPEDYDMDCDGYISIDFATGATCYNFSTSKKYLVRPVRTSNSGMNLIHNAKAAKHHTIIPLLY